MKSIADVKNWNASDLVSSLIHILVMNLPIQLSSITLLVPAIHTHNFSNALGLACSASAIHAVKYGAAIANVHPNPHIATLAISSTTDVFCGTFGTHVTFPNLSNRLVTHAQTFVALCSRNLTVLFAAHLIAFVATFVGSYIFSFSFSTLVFNALAPCCAWLAKTFIGVSGSLGLKKFETAVKILVFGLDVSALAPCCAGVSVAIG